MEWEIRLRPDRTMRGFGSTDFGERTSRLIFMSSSHDRARDHSTLLLRLLSSGRFESDYAILTPTLTLSLARCLFCGKDFFGVWRFENLGNPRARKKRSYSRVSRFFWGKRFFPGQIFGHTRTGRTTDPACRPIPSFPSPFSITWSRVKRVRGLLHTHS